MDGRSNADKSGMAGRRKGRRAPRRATPQYLRAAALHYLERYATSAAHLRRLLVRKVARSAAAHGTDDAEGLRAVDALIADLLRLGLLDHLDQRREKLPLILDDALLRMDDARRLEVYRLLAGIAPTRQIFFLTCHANIAAEAESALKAIRVDLTNHQETP